MMNSEFVHITPDHETDLCQRLYQQWQDSQHCDLIISAKGGELRAHSCVVAAFSPKLKILLEHSAKYSPILGGIFMQLTFEASVVQTLLNMMYTGVLSFSTTLLSSVMSTARWMQMDEVVRLCQDFKDDTGNFNGDSALTDSVLCEVESDGGIDDETAPFNTDSNVQEEPTVSKTGDIMKERNISLVHHIKKEPCLPTQDEEEGETKPNFSLFKMMGRAWQGLENTSLTETQPIPTQKQKKGKASKGHKSQNEVVHLDTSASKDDGTNELVVRFDTTAKQAGGIVIKTEKKWEEADTLRALGSSVASSATDEDKTPSKVSKKILPLKKKMKKGRPRKSSPSKKQKSADVADAAEVSKLAMLSPEERTSKFKELSLLPHDEWMKTHFLNDHDRAEVEFALGKTSHITCRRCLLRFSDTEEYFRHVSDHPTYPCDQCNIRYYRKSNLTRHMRTSHSPMHHLNCRHCDFVAKTENSLRAHYKENHKDSVPFVCKSPGCSYSAWKFQFLNRHSETHSEVKKYICNKCGRGFAQNTGLKSHQRTCFHLQQYLCDFCGQAFNHVGSMRSHRRNMHLGEKPSLCKVCGNRFSDHRNLKRHMLIHENSFPFRCPICYNQYRHSNSLKAHMKKHGDVGADLNVVGIARSASAQSQDQTEKIMMAPSVISDSSDIGGVQENSGTSIITDHHHALMQSHVENPGAVSSAFSSFPNDS